MSVLNFCKSPYFNFCLSTISEFVQCSPKAVVILLTVSHILVQILGSSFFITYIIDWHPTSKDSTMQDCVDTNRYFSV